MRRIVVVLILVGVLTGATAATAQAATRYVSPDGAATGACPSVTPCSLKYGIENAGSGDEIVVTPGTYTETTQVLTITTGLEIHGTARGAAAPLITLSGGGRILTGANFTDVRVSSTATEGLVTSGTLSRVAVHTTNGTACEARTVVDSTCWSDSGPGAAVRSGTATFRNVTAYGGTYGIVAGPTSSGGPVDLEVSNSIARGGTKDLYAAGSTNSGGGDLHATVTVHHSNYVTTGVPDSDGNEVVNGGSNQSGDPLLAAPASGDFHQTPSSPGRDKGVATDGLDVDGDPRTIGDGTDIGADESPGAPAASTQAASDVIASAATFHGTVTTAGATTSYRFEYAASPLFGAATASADVAGGPGTTPVSTRVEGLAPGTLYYVRLVVTNAQGSATGETVTFTTAAAPGGGGAGGTTSDTTAPVLGSLRLTNVAFRVASGLTPLTAARPRGTTLSFRVSEAGTATIAVDQALAGRRRGTSCVAPAKARRGARRCTRWLQRARLTRKVTGARYALRFTGRVGSAALSRRLAIGSYRFRVVVADAAGNRSDQETVRFRIVRR